MNTYHNLILKTLDGSIVNEKLKGPVYFLWWNIGLGGNNIRPMDGLGGMQTRPPATPVNKNYKLAKDAPEEL